MRRIQDIPLQKLFVITISLKVLSSGIGWYIGDPWLLGLVVPLVIMSAYIVLGIKRTDSNVSDEKFADSCYYLGFIFTITSIIFSLFDLPNIGTKITLIAVRFGAAMVSTVFGLVVRVYLVSFKQDAADAVAAVEDRVIEASNRFKEHITIAFEKLRNFEQQVDIGTRATVDRVNLQLEALSKSYAAKLTEFFKELAAENKDASIHALGEVKEASLRLSRSVDEYSKALNSSLKGIEDKATEFAGAVTDRLKTTTFPDDYFAKNLAEPVAKLRESANAIAAGVSDASQDVKASTVLLSTALKSLRMKATNVETALDRVIKLADTQGLIVAKAESQVNALTELSQSIQRFESILALVADKLGAQTVSTVALNERAEILLRRNAESAESAAAIHGQVAHTAEQLPKVLSVVEGMSRDLNALTANLSELGARVEAASSRAIRTVTDDFGVSVVANSQTHAELDAKSKA